MRYLAIRGSDDRGLSASPVAEIKAAPAADKAALSTLAPRESVAVATDSEPRALGTSHFDFG